MVETVCHLQNEPVLLHSLINLGLKRVEQFNWQKTADMVTQVYAKITN